jgi:hypothetical protein
MTDEYIHASWSVSLTLLGHAPPTGTIALDPTFGSFTLLELILHSVNWFLW